MPQRWWWRSNPPKSSVGSNQTYPERELAEAHHFPEIPLLGLPGHTYYSLLIAFHFHTYSTQIHSVSLQAKKEQQKEEGWQQKGQVAECHRQNLQHFPAMQGLVLKDCLRVATAKKWNRNVLPQIRSEKEIPWAGQTGRTDSTKYKWNNLLFSHYSNYTSYCLNSHFHVLCTNVTLILPRLNLYTTTLSFLKLFPDMLPATPLFQVQYSHSFSLPFHATTCT